MKQNYHFKHAQYGGTFSVLHDGHIACLLTAFEIAEHVLIGIKNTEFAQGQKTYKVPPFANRQAIIESWLDKNRLSERAKVYEFGAKSSPDILNPNLECIIIGQDVLEWANKANSERVSIGMGPCHIHIVPFATRDGENLSSMRLMEKQESCWHS